MTRTAIALVALTIPFVAAATEPTPESVDPGPSIWAKQTVGVGLFPKGALSDTKVQYRIPGHRSDSALFQNTYYGLGGRFQLSPAFVDIGPRLSIAPVDVFDLDVQGSWTGYAGPFGPLPMEGVDARAESARNLRSDDEHMVMHKVELMVSPTVKAKVGPVIAFNSTNIGILKAFAPEGVEADLWYEPYRDMVVAYDDVTIENQTAVVYEALDGQNKPKLWLGGTSRYRRALVSKDHYTTAGALVVYKPGTAPAVPTLIGQVLFFVDDPERVGTAPSVNLAATWTFDSPIGLKDAVNN